MTMLGTSRPLFLRAAVLALGVLVVLLAAQRGPGPDAAGFIVGHPFGAALFAIAAAWGLFSVGMNLVRLVLVLVYRPIARPADADLPEITVIVPAYNEGRFVGDTLRSIAASRYPADRLQIIAVDDGSTDDTWLHIRETANALSAGRGVLALRCPTNRGKRHALHAGIVRATGQIIVTIDSDSLIEPDTLANLVAPMVADPSVGAVAGNVRILNGDDGAIPRLLSVSFVLAFDFSRAAESVLGSVLCTPGALAAYRAECVRPVLDQWINQQYMGRPANIGEDRAITNLILRQGRKVKFQSNARVLTKAPTALRGLRRMFTRWARSDVRESIAFARFGFSRFADWPWWKLLLTRMNFLSKALAIALVCPLMLVTLCLAIAYPVTVGLNLVAGAVLGSMWMLGVCLFRGRRLDAPLAVVYAVFWLIALWWITPYGLLTSHRGDWLTRRPTAPPPPAVHPAALDVAA